MPSVSELSTHETDPDQQSRSFTSLAEEIEAIRQILDMYVHARPISAHDEDIADDQERVRRNRARRRSSDHQEEPQQNLTERNEASSDNNTVVRTASTIVTLQADNQLDNRTDNRADNQTDNQTDNLPESPDWHALDVLYDRNENEIANTNLPAVRTSRPSRLSMALSGGAPPVNPRNLREPTTRMTTDGQNWYFSSSSSAHVAATEITNEIENNEIEGNDLGSNEDEVSEIALLTYYRPHRSTYADYSRTTATATVTTDNIQNPENYVEQALLRPVTRPLSRRRESHFRSLLGSASSQLRPSFLADDGGLRNPMNQHADLSLPAISFLGYTENRDEYLEGMPSASHSHHMNRGHELNEGGDTEEFHQPPRPTAEHSALQRLSQIYESDYSTALRASPYGSRRVASRGTVDIENPASNVRPTYQPPAIAAAVPSASRSDTHDLETAFAMSLGQQHEQQLLAHQQRQLLQYEQQMHRRIAEPARPCNKLYMYKRLPPQVALKLTWWIHPGVTFKGGIASIPRRSAYYTRSRSSSQIRQECDIDVKIRTVDLEVNQVTVTIIQHARAGQPEQAALWEGEIVEHPDHEDDNYRENPEHCNNNNDASSYNMMKHWQNLYPCHSMNGRNISPAEPPFPPVWPMSEGLMRFGKQGNVATEYTWLCLKRVALPGSSKQGRPGSSHSSSSGSSSGSSYGSSPGSSFGQYYDGIDPFDPSHQRRQQQQQHANSVSNQTHILLSVCHINGFVEGTIGKNSADMMLLLAHPDDPVNRGGMPDLRRLPTSKVF